MTAAYEDITSPKSFGHRGGRSVGLSTRGRNDAYTVAVKTDAAIVVGHLTEEDFGSLFSVSVSKWYDRN